METYLVVRAHGLKTRLLTKKDYEDIVHGKRALSEFKDYSSLKDDMDLGDKINEIYKVYISRMKLLAKLAPEYSDFIYAFLDRLEIENIKIQLRNIYGKKSTPYFYPYSRKIDLAQLSQVSSEDELWELAEKTPYLQNIAIPKFAGEIAEREFFLDDIYYIYLLSQITGTRRLAKKLAPVVDVVELEYLQRLFYWKIALGEEFWKILARFPKPFAISEKSFERLFLKLDISENKVSELLSERKLTELMNMVTLALVRYAEYVLRPYSAELPFIYTYNLMAYVEAINLERVVIGLDTGLPEETILAALIYIKS